MKSCTNLWAAAILMLIPPLTARRQVALSQAMALTTFPTTAEHQVLQPATAPSASPYPNPLPPQTASAPQPHSPTSSRDTTTSTKYSPAVVPPATTLYIS